MRSGPNGGTRMKQLTQNFKFMKIIGHHMVCWSLLFFQASPVMGSAAEDKLRESVDVEREAAVVVGSGTSNDGSSEAGVVELVGKDERKTSSLILSNLAILGAALTAPALLKNCRKMSTYIYAAASFVYVANEIGLISKFKAAGDKQMKAFLGRGDEEDQIESLKTAAQQTREAVESARQRAKIAKIAGAGFAAAAAMAVYEGMKPGGSPCVSTAGILKNDDRPLGPNNFSSQKLFALLEQANAQMRPNSYVLIKEQVDFHQGGLLSLSIDGSMPLPLQDEIEALHLEEAKSKVTEFLKLASSLLVDSAHAGFDWGNNKTRYGALGLGLVGARLVKNIGRNIYKKGLNHPYKRAIAFVGFGTIAVAASNSSEVAADSLEERAQEYEKLASQLKARVNQTTSSSGSLTEVTKQSIADSNAATSAATDLANTCFTGSPGTLREDSGCDCAKTQTCKQPEVPSLAGIEDFNGKSLIVDSLKDFATVGKNLYNGRLKNGTTAGQSLSKNAARITRLRKSMEDKLNKDRKKNGKKAIPFDGLQKKFESGLLKEVNNAFKNLSPSERSSLASIAPGLGGDAKAGNDKDGESKVAGASDSSSRSVSAVDVNPNAGAVNKGDANQGGNWDFDFDEDKTEEEKAAIAAALAVEDENYVVEGDISEDRNKNLFKIITSRYLKSAYPVIFEEKK